VILVWIACGLVAIAGLAALLYFFVWQRRDTKPTLSFNLAVTEAKRALQDGRATITVVAEGGERVPYVPAKDKAKQVKFGTFQFVTDGPTITYTADQYTDEAIIALVDYEEKVTLMYTEGELSGAWIGRQALAPESFELRQGKAAGSNLRKLLRKKLRLPATAIK
jgi:hypothetical protein